MSGSKRISQCDTLWAEAVEALDRGDMAIGEERMRQASDWDPRIPPGRGPAVSAATDERMAEARRWIASRERQSSAGNGQVPTGLGHV